MYGLKLMAKQKDFVMFNLKVRPELHLEFKVAAGLDGLDMSNMVRQFMIRVVREAKARDAAQFEEALNIAREEEVKETAKAKRLPSAKPEPLYFVNNTRNAVDVAIETGIDINIVLRILSNMTEGIPEPTVRKVLDAAGIKADDKPTHIRLANGKQ
jgi:hypothetical protein